MTNESIENTEISQRLQKIENQIDRIVAQPAAIFGESQSYRNDEINLEEVWNILWKGKWWIIGITFLFVMISVFYALSLPNQYKSEIVLAPAQEHAGGLGGLAAQYGGLAAMAGINLGGGQSSDIDQAIALVKSWPFLDAFVERYNIKPLVMAVAGWDRDTDKVIFDRNIYDPDSKQWLREPKPNLPTEPISYEVYEVLSKMVSVSHDAKTGLIRISVEHHVPHLAYEWSGLLVKEVNQHFQNRDVREASQNIDYLRAKIQETSIADMQSVFYRMIETQLKTLMLAEVSEEYLLKTVVQPKVPEIKSKPKRAFICVLGVILGSMTGVLIVVLLHFRKKLMTRIPR